MYNRSRRFPKPVRKINSSRLNSSRSTIIDDLETFYNDDYEYVESVIQEVTDVDINDVDIDESDDEGFWSYFSTDELASILETLKKNEEDNDEYNLPLSREQIILLKEAMENYSDPAFSRSGEDSRIASRILRKIEKIY